MIRNRRPDLVSRVRWSFLAKRPLEVVPMNLACKFYFRRVNAAHEARKVLRRGGNVTGNLITYQSPARERMLLKKVRGFELHA